MSQSQRTTEGRVARDARANEAANRQSYRDQRVAAQQIAALDARLGVGKGATRERARLAAVLSDALA